MLYGLVFVRQPSGGCSTGGVLTLMPDPAGKEAKDDAAHDRESSRRPGQSRAVQPQGGPAAGRSRLSMKGSFPSSVCIPRRKVFSFRFSGRTVPSLNCLAPGLVAVHRFGLDRLDRPIYPFVLASGERGLSRAPSCSLTHLALPARALSLAGPTRHIISSGAGGPFTKRSEAVKRRQRP